MTELDLENQRLMEEYGEEIEKFKAFCTSPLEGEFDEIEFYDLSLGFFIALGVTKDTINNPPEPFGDAFGLALLCRYTFHYWC